MNFEMTSEYENRNSPEITRVPRRRQDSGKQ